MATRNKQNRTETIAEMIVETNDEPKVEEKPTKENVYKVNVDTLSVRKTRTALGLIVDRLSKGKEVKVLEIQGEWATVPNGYILLKYLDKV